MRHRLAIPLHASITLDAANRWRYSEKEEQQALNSAIDE